MPINLKIFLHSVIPLVMAIFLTPVTANAYTSTGADGAFQPTTSVILNSSQTVYNFTSIFIPTGVTVSFSGVASQPIEFLATGNIDIAGNIDLGGNSLLIDTGGSLSLPSTGSLIGTAGSSISLALNLQQPRCFSPFLQSQIQKVITCNNMERHFANRNFTAS